MYREHLQKFIPPEFDLEKYDGGAIMELIYWIDNLVKRISPFNCYLENDYSFKEYLRVGGKGFFNLNDDGLSQKERCEKDVLRNISAGVLLAPSVHDMFEAFFMDGTTHHLSIVKGVTYEDLFLLDDEFITDEKKKLYSMVEPSFFPSIYENNLGELNNVIRSVDSNGDIDLSWLQIDMKCCDCEITEAFSRWLKQTRGEQKEKQKSKTRERKLNHFNQVTFRKWHDAKVLPYIDLITWNFLQKNKVTNKIIGEILFPDPRVLSDKTKIIEDTTRPYASKLTSLSIKRRMISVLVEQHRKKNTEKTS